MPVPSVRQIGIVYDGMIIPFNRRVRQDIGMAHVSGAVDGEKSSRDSDWGSGQVTQCPYSLGAMRITTGQYPRVPSQSLARGSAGGFLVWKLNDSRLL